MRATIVRVDQSPLNPRRWLLALSCGHERWVTNVRRPTRRTETCLDCTRAALGEAAPSADNPDTRYAGCDGAEGAR